jgi:hypothetical protein
VHNPFLHHWKIRCLIASGYSYFLIYAQFGFIELLTESRLSDQQQQYIMGMMALGGIFTSFALIYYKTWLARGLDLGMWICLFGTGVSLYVHSFEALLLAALSIGVGIAMSTVANPAVRCFECDIILHPLLIE